jgi:hypothetical protein
MAKHTNEPKKGITKQEKLRQDNLAKLEPLSPRWIAHISEALGAVRPCDYCNIDGAAAKLDENNRCLKCHGTKYIADNSQRNWAAEEVGSRIAPKPKPSEIVLDDKRDFEELAEKAKDISNDDLNTLAKHLGITFDEENG